MQIGAQYRADLVQLIPRSESEEWRELLDNAVSSMQVGLRWELLGPHRFGEAASTHLEMIIWHPDVASPKLDQAQVAMLLKALKLALQNGKSCGGAFESHQLSTLYYLPHLSTSTRREA